MKKNKILLTLIFISIIISMGLGTYSYFTAATTGNKIDENIVQTTGTLKIEYIEGQNIDADKIRPGWTDSKTFTIRNTGTLPVNYDIVFDELLNTFINNEILISGICTSNQNSCDDITEMNVDKYIYIN